MITSLNDWLSYLRGSDPLLGVPMVVVGAALCLFGWRLWRLCVVASFGIIGYGLGATFFSGQPEQLWYTIPIVLGLAGLSYPLASYAVAVLGGLLGAAAVAHLLSDLRVDSTVYWIIVGVAFFGATGYALISRRLVVIVVTAAIGAGLVLSGLTAFLMASPSAYGTLRAVVNSSVIALPFVMLVPTVMSCFYQVAEVNRLQREL